VIADVGLRRAGSRAFSCRGRTIGHAVSHRGRLHRLRGLRQATRGIFCGDGIRAASVKTPTCARLDSGAYLLDAEQVIRGALWTAFAFPSLWAPPVDVTPASHRPCNSLCLYVPFLYRALRWRRAATYSTGGRRGGSWKVGGDGCRMVRLVPCSTKFFSITVCFVTHHCILPVLPSLGAYLSYYLYSQQLAA